jgi:hypothetical protein
LVGNLNSFFRSIRQKHTEDFTSLFSAEDRKNYISGLTFVLYWVALFAFLWAIIILVLKYRSRDFGCASGNEFQTNDDFLEGHTHTHHITRNEPTEYNSSLASSSAESSTTGTRYLYTKEEIARNRRRASRTRIAFLILGFGVLTSIILFLILSFARIKESLQSTEISFFESQEIINQVKAALLEANSAGMFAVDLLSKTDLSFSVLCPDARNFRNQSSFDLEAFGMKALEDVEKLKAIVVQNLSSWNETMNQVQDMKDSFENDVREAQQFSWLVPGILLGIVVINTIVILGVILAWKGKSGKRFQNCLSYIALPVLIIFCVASWGLTLLATAGAMSSGDACVAFGKEGGPDATAISILNGSLLEKNGTVYKMTYSYIDSCRQENPTLDLMQLEESLQITVNSIWLEISKIDEIGRDSISEFCGNDLSSFLDGIRQVAKALSTIRKSLDSVTRSLECKNVNPIYVSIIHDSFCDEIAPGLAIAFILFLILSTFLMGLISLRASWLHQGDQVQEEEKVYSEDEAAQNMVLNEYEEYLSYIAKYKHEWEDYEGIRSSIRSASPQDPDFQLDVEDNMVPTKSLDESIYTDEDDHAESEYESSAAESSLPDDISFPSLQITPSIAEAPSDIMVVQYLLPRNDSNEEEAETFEVISPRFKSNVCIPSTIHTLNLSNEIRHERHVEAQAQLQNIRDVSTPYLASDSESNNAEACLWIPKEKGFSNQSTVHILSDTQINSKDLECDRNIKKFSDLHFSNGGQLEIKVDVEDGKQQLQVKKKPVEAKFQSECDAFGNAGGERQQQYIDSKSNHAVSLSNSRNTLYGKGEHSKGQKRNLDGSQPVRTVQFRLPSVIGSEDDDSIVANIMKSFDVPQSSGEDDDEMIEAMYGIKLRNKSSMEAELEAIYDVSSKTQLHQ